MEWYYMAGAIFLTLIIALASSLPVAFSLGMVSIIWMVALLGPAQVLQLVTVYPFSTVNSWSLTVLPMFVFMAEVLMFTGISKDLFEVLYKWLGKLPGGLAIASVIACAFFASIVGGSTVTAIAVGLIAIPEMLNRGYNRSLATGCVAAAGTLGILIPPSAIMIIYSIATEAPIGDLFVAGVVPGWILAFVFAIYVFIKVRRNPTLAPKLEEEVTWKDRFVCLWKIWPVLFLVLLVLVGIYTGVVSGVESGAVGAFGSIILAFIYKKITWANLKQALFASIKTSTMVGTIIIGAMLLGFVLANFDVASNLAAFVAGLEVSRWLVMALIMMVLIFLGCFLEPVSIIFITMPIFFPIILELGFDQVWFGIMVVINMEMANMTPPVGLNVYVISGITKHLGVSLGDVFNGVYAFVMMDAVMLVALCVFPQIALWLPSTMAR